METSTPMGRTHADSSKPQAIKIITAEPIISLLKATTEPSKWRFSASFSILSYILLWYTFSTALSLWNKRLLGIKQQGLDMPLMLSSLHALVQYCLAFLFIRKKPVAITDIRSYIQRVVPCAFASAVEVGGANLSLVFISLSFYTMVKSSAPIFIVIFAFLFKLEKPRLSLILIMLAICLGVAITVAGELDLNPTGLVLVLSATVASGLRWTLTHLLLHDSDFRHPIVVIKALAPFQFALLFILSFIIEDPITHFSNMPTMNHRLIALGSMAAGGLLAFCMTLAEFHLIKATSTITLSVAGIAKELVMLLAGAIAFKDILTPLNIIGLAISLGGIIAYNRFRYIQRPKLQQKEYEIVNMDEM